MHDIEENKEMQEEMFEQDATDDEIEYLQKRLLLEAGITQSELDLRDYVGLTFSELFTVFRNAVRKKVFLE